MLPNYMAVRPPCPKCTAKMVLTFIEPDEPGFDSRNFECPSCNHVEKRIVVAPG